MSNIFAYFINAFLTTAIILRLFISSGPNQLGTQLFITSFICLAFFIWLISQSIQGEIRLQKLGLLGWLLLGWCVIIVISTMIAGDKLRALTVAVTWLSDIILFYLIVQTASDGLIHLPTIIATGIIISLYALYQYGWGLEEVRQLVRTGQANLNITPEMSEEFFDRINANEPFGTFIYQNSLGAFLVLLIPVILGVLLSIWRPKSEVPESFRGKAGRLLFSGFCIVSLGLMLFILFHTGSKGAWVAASLSLIIFLIVRLWSYLTKYLRLMIISGLIILLVIGGVFFTLIVTNQPLPVSANKVSESLNVRMDYWRGAGEVIKHHPWFGVGLNNFNDHYLMYKSSQAGETTRAHNVLLEIFSELGVFGFIIFVAIWLIIVIRSLLFVVRAPPANNQEPTASRPLREPVRDKEQLITNNKSRTTTFAIILGAFLAFILAQIFQGLFIISEEMPLLFPIVFFTIWTAGFLLIQRLSSGARHYIDIGLFAGIISFLIHSLVDFNFYEGGLSISIWLIAAFVYSRYLTTQPPVLTRFKTSPVVTVIMLVIALVFIGWLNLKVTLPVLEADALLEDAKAKIYSWEPKGFQEGYEKLIEAANLNPYSSEAWSELARIYFGSINNPQTNEYVDKAFKAVNRAISLSPYRAYLHCQKGQMLEIQAERCSALSVDINTPRKLLRESLEAYEQAAKYYPTRPTTFYQLGLIARKANEYDRAGAAFLEALRLSEAVPLKRLKLSPAQIAEIQQYLKETDSRQ